MKNKRVVVAMSGGVDSSVAAWLLKKQGYEVIGITMCFNVSHENRKKPACCGLQGIEDARRVAEKIGIKHYVLNFGKQLETQIIDNFCSEYLKGRTPNPCVRCNQFLKFDSLLKKAKLLDAKFLATGHYARVEYDRATKRYVLKKGRDARKDQSYFLYSIGKKTLPHILLPLGKYTKNQVRSIAQKISIKVADKPGSQEICFIPADYQSFLRERLSKKKVVLKPGRVLTTEGKVVGEHKGICFHTIGQRGGLGIALGHRAYIISIDARTNTIVIGKEKELYSRSLIADKINFISIDFPKKTLRASAKIRYNGKQSPCIIIPLSNRRVQVEFLRPQRAITPGQSVVFYQKKLLLGGGVIR
ncbi:tRNA 2-thiouridine(34) synthase MnmA [Candidatus Omnitrophota bacterium]